MPRTSEIVAAYDRWAAVYDADPNRTRDLAWTVLRAAPLELSDRRVLELGCGTGRNTAWLAERSRHVVGTDASPAMLHAAVTRAGAGRATFVRCDVAASWPLAAASVDVVLAVLVLEHVEHLARVFEEAARVLVPGGDVFLCELHPVRQLAGKQAEFRAPETGELVRVPAFLHDTSDYVRAGIAAGFAPVDMQEWRDPGAPRRDPPRLLSLAFRNGRTR